MKKYALIASLLILTLLSGCAAQAANSPSAAGAGAETSAQGATRGGQFANMTEEEMRERMRAADVFGEVKSVVGNEVTIKLAKPMTLPNRQVQSGQNQSGNAQGQNQGRTGGNTSGGGNAGFAQAMPAGGMIIMGPGGPMPGGTGGQNQTRTRTQSLELEFTGEELTVTIPVGIQISKSAATITFDKIATRDIIQIWKLASDSEKVERITVVSA